MPPSQESSSDSVFTDPEELAGATNGAKEEAASTSLALVLKSHEVGSSSMSPLFGERNSYLLLLVTSIRDLKMSYRTFQSIWPDR